MQAGEIMETRMYSLKIKTQDGLVGLNVLHEAINRDHEGQAVTLSTVICGKKTVIHAGTTEEALIQLAKRLPEGWSLRSCLSCRYGHFCPVGDCDNELFCVTEFEPRSPRDLWSVTEDEEERSRRSRSLFDSCGAYLPQTENDYTYNDYAFRMNGPKE